MCFRIEIVKRGSEISAITNKPKHFLSLTQKTFSIFLPIFAGLFDDFVETEDCHAAGEADHDGGGDDEEDDHLDPNILEDDQEVDKETGDEDDESAVKQQPW